MKTWILAQQSELLGVFIHALPPKIEVQSLALSPGIRATFWGVPTPPKPAHAPLRAMSDLRPRNAIVSCPAGPVDLSSRVIFHEINPSTVSAASVLQLCGVAMFTGTNRAAPGLNQPYLR